MRTKSLLIVVVLSLSASFAWAQDTMILRNKEELKVKIVELGVSEIKYKLPPYALETPIRSIEKFKVAKVIFESGEEIVFDSNPLLDTDMYADQRTRAIKVNFLSPLNATLFIAYEQNIKPGQSFEIEAGFIGAGFDADASRPRGFSTRLGYKFIRTPDYYVPGMRRTHILKGAYFKPEIIFSTYKYNDFNFDFGQNFNSTERPSVSGGAFLLNLGKQWIFSECVALDTFVGLGYGFSSNDDAIRYGFFGGDASFPIAFSSGVRVGYLIR